jgi:hypothetical protein
VPSMRAGAEVEVGVVFTMSRKCASRLTRSFGSPCGALERVLASVVSVVDEDELVSEVVVLVVNVCGVLDDVVELLVKSEVMGLEMVVVADSARHCRNTAWKRGLSR